MRKNPRISRLVIIAICVSAIAILYIYNYYTGKNLDSSGVKTISNIATTTPASSLETTPSLPNTFSLPVPFTSQAPGGVWDEMHKEACEETSSLMAAAYFAGKREEVLAAKSVNVEIARLQKWEEKTFGYHTDINTQETARMLEEVYDLKTKILESFSETDLKAELAVGHLILVPANGILLNNPNFRSPGPPYHMLVITGYTENTFITNDPGTRNGKDYIYTFKTLYDANGNWDHEKDEVDLDAKTVLIVWQE